ncbi:hypothetical protein V4762_09940, partial [Thermodesulfobium sp. 4217-1]|uniref:hypothetical protein n=1 Tax=Thermodesulfobium sp. 4217-1 TaxID=3120013 RepID=UPI003221FFDD
ANNISLNDSGYSGANTISNNIAFFDNSAYVSNLTQVDAAPATHVTFDFSHILTSMNFDTTVISENNITSSTLSAALADADSQAHTASHNAGYFTDDTNTNTYFFADGANGPAVIELVGTIVGSVSVSGTTVHITH